RQILSVTGYSDNDGRGAGSGVTGVLSVSVGGNGKRNAGGPGRYRRRSPGAGAPGNSILRSQPAGPAPGGAAAITTQGNDVSACYAASAPRPVCFLFPGPSLYARTARS